MRRYRSAPSLRENGKQLLVLRYLSSREIIQTHGRSTWSWRSSGPNATASHHQSCITGKIPVQELLTALIQEGNELMRPEYALQQRAESLMQIL